MSNIRNYPIDNFLKEIITNIVGNELTRININMTENERFWFKNECAECIIENVLQSIIQWEKIEI